MKIRSIDTLEFGLDIHNYKKEFKPIIQELKELREIGFNTGKEQLINYGGINFTLKNRGMRFYPFRLESEDFVIGLAEKPLNTNSEVFVKLKAGILWSYGYKEAYVRFKEWFSIFPGEIIGSRTSRLDICLDIDEIEFDQSDIDKIIARAKSKTNYHPGSMHKFGSEFSGFSIGKGNPIMARIYNKTLENKGKGKTWFETVWTKNGWDGQKTIWRIEFQLRRKALKELGIEKVENIKENEDRLWNYLTSKWLKIEDVKWETVIETNEPITDPLVRQKVRQGNLVPLTNQIIGIMVSIGVLINSNSLKEVQEYVEDKLEEKHRNNETSFIKEVNKRRSKFYPEANETSIGPYKAL